MEITDLNLDFLWADKGGPILGKVDPFWEVWSPEREKYIEFIETESIPKLIELLVISFKDKFPRDYWNPSITIDGMEVLKRIRQEGDYKVLEGSDLRNEDLKEFKWLWQKDAKGFDYVHERAFKFEKEFDLFTVVETALAENTFTKTVGSLTTVYAIESSPLAEIEVGPKSFRMTINPANYKRPRR